AAMPPDDFERCSTGKGLLFSAVDDFDQRLDPRSGGGLFDDARNCREPAFVAGEKEIVSFRKAAAARAEEANAHAGNGVPREVGAGRDDARLGVLEEVDGQLATVFIDRADGVGPHDEGVLALRPADAAIGAVARPN